MNCLAVSQARGDVYCSQKRVLAEPKSRQVTWGHWQIIKVSSEHYHLMPSYLSHCVVTRIKYNRVATAHWNIISISNVNGQFSGIQYSVFIFCSIL